MASRRVRRAAVALCAAAVASVLGLGTFGGAPRARHGAGAVIRWSLGAVGLQRADLAPDRGAGHGVGAQPMPPPPAQPPLAPLSDRSWWQAALAIRHHPVPSALSLAVVKSARPSVAVFVYHQVAPLGWPLQNGPDSITPEKLAVAFAFLRVRGIATLTPAQFVAYLNGHGHARPGSVFLTFDNGLEGVYRYAYPLVRRYHVHITVFLIGDRVLGRWRPGDRFLAWDQIERMARSGLVAFESETYDLHSIETVARGRYGPDVGLRWQTYPYGHEETLAGYLKRLRYGLTEQRVVFWRNLHTIPTLLVWPFSTYDLAAELEARAAGYTAAFAVYPGVVTPLPGSDRYSLPRNPATFMWDNVPAEYEAIYGRSVTAAERGALVAVTPQRPGLHGPPRRA